jgi:hypothetical protein
MGHVACMEEKLNPFILNKKSEGKKPLEILCHMRAVITKWTLKKWGVKVAGPCDTVMNICVM